MVRPLFLTAASSSNQISVALRLMESLSLRPKMASVPILGLGGAGMFYGARLLTARGRDESRKNPPRLWDFFDPQGHHQIYWKQNQ